MPLDMTLRTLIPNWYVLVPKIIATKNPISINENNKIDILKSEFGKVLPIKKTNSAAISKTTVIINGIAAFLFTFCLFVF